MKFLQFRSLPTTPALLLAMLLLNACAGHMTMTTDFQSKMSQTIFLDPSVRGAEAKTVLVQVRNTSDNQKMALGQLPEKLAAKGYTVITDGQKAHYMVQANVLYCNKARAGTTMDTLIGGGFGAAVGATAASTVAMASNNLGTSALSAIPGAGLIGGLLGAAGAKVTEDTVFLCATDLQITEKTDEIVEQTITKQTGSPQPSQSGGLLSGMFGQAPSAPDPGTTSQATTEVRRGKNRIHQTRVVVSAQKMWLNLDEATIQLSQRLEDSIANIF